MNANYFFILRVRFDKMTLLTCLTLQLVNFFEDPQHQWESKEKYVLPLSILIKHLPLTVLFPSESGPEKPNLPLVFCQ